MPIVDMPLEELKTYQGTNPRPDDLDSFWEAALTEMQETDPEVTLAPSDFQAPFAECFDLSFTGVRGARIHAKYLRPTNIETPHPAVLQFHGYSGNSGSPDRITASTSGTSTESTPCNCSIRHRIFSGKGMGRVRPQHR